MFDSPMNTNVFPPRPGTWVPGGAKGARAAFFTCPSCGVYGPLGSVNDAGVALDVVCPNEDFADDVTLLGWPV